MCLHPVELMQIFPLTSAGLGLTPSLRIALEMLLMEITSFAIQDPKQNQVPPPQAAPSQAQVPFSFA